MVSPPEFHCVASWTPLSKIWVPQPHCWVPSPAFPDPSGWSQVPASHWPLVSGEAPCAGITGIWWPVVQAVAS